MFKDYKKICDRLDDFQEHPDSWFKKYNRRALPTFMALLFNDTDLCIADSDDEFWFFKVICRRLVCKDAVEWCEEHNPCSIKDLVSYFKSSLLTMESVQDSLIDDCLHPKH